MQLDKKKYTGAEVQRMFDAYKKHFESRYTEQQKIISGLTRELNEMKSQVESVSSKEALIIAVLRRAEQTAMDLDQQVNAKYKEELERLITFSSDWDDFFNALREKYPEEEQVKKAVLINEKLNSEKNKAQPKLLIRELEQMISEEKVHPNFDPKKKIADYIEATSDGGFSMEDVLNPGELKLEDICRELGLIDEDE